MVYQQKKIKNKKTLIVFFFWFSQLFDNIKKLPYNRISDINYKFNIQELENGGKYMEIFFSILLVVVGISTGFLISYYIINTKFNNSAKKAEELIEKAKKEAEKTKRDSMFELKEEMHKLKLENEKEIKERKEELKVTEDRLIQREYNMDKSDELFQKREFCLH